MENTHKFNIEHIEHFWSSLSLEEKKLHIQEREALIFEGNDFVNLFPRKELPTDLIEKLEYENDLIAMKRTCVFVETLNAKEIDNKYQFKINDFVKNYNVYDPVTNRSYMPCENVQFREEPLLGKFSGFWISPGFVVTADHTKKAPVPAISDTRILSGYYMNTYKDNMVTIPKEDVIEIEKKISLDPDKKHLDILFYKVKSSIILSENHFKFGKAERGEKVYSIGYPLGLPAKICKMGVIRDEDEDFYYTDLDTLNKSSGSAVFNFNDEIIGMILTKGKSPEFVIEKDCGCWKFNSEDYSKESENYTKVLKIESILNQFKLLTKKTTQHEI